MQIPKTPDRKAVIASFVLYLVLVLFLYFSAFSSMFSIWMASETYAHGLIIVPVVLFLLWTKREIIANISFVPDARVSIVIAFLSLLWFCASLVNVNFFQQIAAMLLLPAGVFAILGREAFLKYRFPLLYLLLAVPMGEALVPWLQDYTASFTVKALQLFNFPVFVDGRYFETASGKYEVTTACSGIRYLLASFAVGCLYAYLQFRSLRNRVIIVVLSLVLPIVANGVRAFVIVLIVHYSDGKWGMGSDHFYYGWLFFAVVMGLLFTLGRFFRDKASLHVEFYSQATSSVPGHWVMALSFSAIALLCGPLLMVTLKQDNQRWQAQALSNVKTGSEWKVSAPEYYDWFPHFDNALLEVKVQLNKGDARVKFESVYTSVLSRRGELHVNRHLLNTKFWKILRHKELDIELNTPINTSANINGIELKLAAGGKTRLVFYYYNVSGTILRSRTLVKLHELAQVLTGTYRYTALHWVQIVELPGNTTANEVLTEVLENFDPASLVDFGNGQRTNSPESR